MDGSTNAHARGYLVAVLLLGLSVAALCASLALSGAAEAQQGTEALSNAETEDLNAQIEELDGRYDRLEGRINRLENQDSLEAGAQADDLEYEQDAVNDEIDGLQKDLVEEKLQIVENAEIEGSPQERVNRLEEIEGALEALDTYADNELSTEDWADVNGDIDGWHSGTEDSLEEAQADLEAQQESGSGSEGGGGGGDSGGSDGSGGFFASVFGFIGGLLRLLAVAAGLGIGGVIAYRVIKRYGLFEPARADGSGGPSTGGDAGPGPPPGPGPTVGGDGDTAGDGDEDSGRQPQDGEGQREPSESGSQEVSTRTRQNAKMDLGRAQEIVEESAEKVRQNHGLEITIGQGVADKLAEQSKGKEDKLRSLVQQQVEDRIDDHIFNDRVKSGMHVEVGLRPDGTIGVREKQDGG